MFLPAKLKKSRKRDKILEEESIRPGSAKFF